MQTPSISKYVLGQKGSLSWIKQQKAPKAEVQYGHIVLSSFDSSGDLAGKWLEPSFCSAGSVSSTASIFSIAPGKHILAPFPFSLFLPKLFCKLHQSFEFKNIYHHLPPWIKSFDLFRHRRLAIISWVVHDFFFLEVCIWGRVSEVWCCPFFQDGWSSFVCVWISHLVFQRSLDVFLWLRFLFCLVLCII